MSTKFLRLFAAAGALAYAACAHAEPATWQVLGTITDVDGTPGVEFPAAFTPGTPFRVVATFDTAATLQATQLGSVGGLRYVYDPSSVRLAVFIGSECSPCDPSTEAGFDPASGVLLVRDNYDDPLRNGTSGPLDGYTIGVRAADGTSVNLLMRGPVLDIVNGPALAASPDPRLADLPLSALDVCLPNGEGCLRGAIESVIAPTSGVGYLFTARDCRVPQSNPQDTFLYDCVNAGAQRAQQWSFPARAQIGGGLGWPGFDRSFSPSSSEIDGLWGTTLHAATGLPAATLGQLYGSVTFASTVVQMPLLRGASVPADFGRTNANLFGYQRYTNDSAEPTPLPIEIDFTYSIDDNRIAVPAPEPSVWPGVGSISVVLSVLDGAVPMETVRTLANQGFGSLTCGAEASVGLPAGSILGAATYSSPPGAEGDVAVAIPLRRCGAPDEFVTVAARGSVTLAASMQSPARGKAAQPTAATLTPREGAGVEAIANGWVTSVNTFAVAPDRSAPRDVVAQFVTAVAPSCASACGEIEVEVTHVDIDVKPGSADNSINPGAQGGIPVAIFGGPAFEVSALQLDTLKLGSLGLRMRGEQPQCSVQRVNGDGYDDLVCHFQNASSGWVENEGRISVTGRLYTGVPVEGSDAVRLVR